MSALDTALPGGAVLHWGANVPYRFALDRGDYSAFAGGKVLHSLPGRTAFPVRLASELFQRCAAVLAAAGVRYPYLLFDPCCGGGQLLTTLAYLHGETIRGVAGSDVDADAVSLAARNLSLLTLPGLAARIAALAALRDRYGKASHADAVAQAVGLRSCLVALTWHRSIATQVFQADATQPSAFRDHFVPHAVDMVITDVPYGQRSHWHATTPLPEPASPVWHLLDALYPVLAAHGVVAVAANRGQRVQHERYRRVDQLRIGKRHVVVLTPSEESYAGSGAAW